MKNNFKFVNNYVISEDEECQPLKLINEHDKITKCWLCH